MMYHVPVVCHYRNGARPPEEKILTVSSPSPESARHYAAAQAFDLFRFHGEPISYTVAGNPEPVGCYG